MGGNAITTSSTGTSSTVPVLVFGSGITALGVVRVLRDAGVPAYVVGCTAPVVAQSRWFRAAPISQNGVSPEADLAAYLESLTIPRAVLMPCADSWSLRIAGLEGALTERFPSFLAPAAVLEGLIDKSRLAEAARAAEVPHPSTILLENASDFGAISDGAFRQGFLKPRNSEGFFRRFGTKAFWESSREAAIGRWREARNEGLGMLFQEYIPGDADRHYFLDGLADRTGRVTALFARRRLRMYPPRFGNSTLMMSVPLDQTGDAPNHLARLLERASFRGIFSAEFKRDARDERFKLLEVNVRPWWYVEFAARCGVDVVGMAYGAALGLPVEPAPAPSYRVGRRCVYPYHDYWAYRELRREGRISPAAWAGSLFGAAQPLFRWSDPYPAWDELRAVLLRWLRGAATRRIRESAMYSGWRALRAMWRVLTASARAVQSRTERRGVPLGDDEVGR